MCIFWCRRGTHSTYCGLVTPYDDIDIGQFWSGNGLLPDGTKPFPKPILIYYHPVALHDSIFTGRTQDISPSNGS